MGTNLNGGDCKDVENPEYNSNSDCASNWITDPSMGNKKSKTEVLRGQQVLNVVAIIAIVLVLFLMRRAQRIVVKECDVSDISVTDYSILVKGIPIN